MLNEILEKRSIFAKSDIKNYQHIHLSVFNMHKGMISSGQRIKRKYYAWWSSANWTRSRTCYSLVWREQNPDLLQSNQSSNFKWSRHTHTNEHLIVSNCSIRHDVKSIGCVKSTGLGFYLILTFIRLYLSLLPHLVLPVETFFIHNRLHSCRVISIYRNMSFSWFLHSAFPNNHCFA